MFFLRLVKYFHQDCHKYFQEEVRVQWRRSVGVWWNTRMLSWTLRYCLRSWSLPCFRQWSIIRILPSSVLLHMLQWCHVPEPQKAPGFLLVHSSRGCELKELIKIVKHKKSFEVFLRQGCHWKNVVLTELESKLFLNKVILLNIWTLAWAIRGRVLEIH